MSQQHPSRPSLESVVNFRDIGGYATADGRVTRANRVYRSGHLAELSDRDRDTLKSLGLRLVCDLRWPEEVERIGRDRLDDGGVRYAYEPVTIPRNDSASSPRGLSPQDADLSQFQRSALTSGAESFRRILSLFADEANYPLLIHCTNGVNRTGLVVALVLKLAGVSDDDVIRDYTSSTLAHLQEEERNADGPPVAEPQGEHLARTLAWLNATYGSVEAYVRSIGLTDDQVRAIRELLVE